MLLEPFHKSNEMTCPICNGVGQKVRKVTVEHQVQSGVDIEGKQFYLCKTPDCKVAYYTPDGKKTIHQDKLVNKIWFKTNIYPPIPICYCGNVTEEEILHHVAVAQCCSTLDDIKRHTGANTGCKCLTENPAGS